MKRLFAALSLAIIACSFSACGFIEFNSVVSSALVDNAEVANNTFQKIITAVSNRDANAIKKLFSNNVKQQVDDMDEKISELFEFIQGDIISYSDAKDRGVGVSTKTEHGKRRKDIQPCFCLTTSMHTYYFAIRECMVDTFDPNNEGLLSIYIIDADDWTEAYVYRGDSAWTPGINVVE